MVQLVDFHRPSFEARHAPPKEASIKTIPQLIAFNARNNPKLLFCNQAEAHKDEAGHQSLVPVTYGNLEHAILQCQSWLRENVRELKLPCIEDGERIVRGPPVALLMDSDVGILFHFFALVGLGVPALLLSARLSPLAIQGLLVQTSARAIITSRRLETTAKEAVSIIEDTEEKPGLYATLPYNHFLTCCEQSLSDRVWSENHYISDTDRNVLILHSSGTTGLPKAIPQSHRYMLSYATCHSFRDRSEAQGMNVSTLPLFHGFGLIPPCLALSVGKTFTIPRPQTTPTGRSTAELLRLVKASSLMSVPSIIEDICSLPDGEGIEVLKSLKFVASGGGALKPSFGDIFTAAGIKIVNSYGTTETGPLSVMYVPDTDSDWRYFRIREDMDIQFLEGSQATQAEESSLYRLLVRPPGWESTFETQDDLISHPQKIKRELRPAGRVDDVLVLATGEKVSPQIVELLLCERTDVRAALMFGNDQFQPGILVEPSHPVSLEAQSSFKSAIWPTIQEAGKRMDAHARVSTPEAIIILRPDQRLPRSDKAAVIRRESYEMFADEIASVYKNLEDSVAQVSVDLFDGDLEENIRQLVQNLVGWRCASQDFSRTEDLFDLGIDSLQATQLRRLLLSAISKSKGSSIAAQQIPRDFVYEHPSISDMAARLREDDVGEQSTSLREDAIQQLVDKYSTSPPFVPQSDSGAVVLLTGGTGSLGTHVLSQLGFNESVRRIICLNRPTSKDPYDRQFECSRAKGAEIPKASRAKIEVLEANSALPQLGLPSTIHRRLANEVTHIVHNAWPMDFKRKLRSFETQFKVLSNLLDFARAVRVAQSELSPRFLFVSSISVVGNHRWTVAHEGGRLAPEQPIRDARKTLQLGYAEAKLVCERILERATRESEIGKEVDAMIVRMGQITGATESGFWNSDEHFPALVKSSIQVGALPELKGTASWIPVDTAAATLTELLLAPQPTRLIYHIENPVRQSWHDLLQVLSRHLLSPSSEGRLPVISFDEWLSRIRNVPDHETGSTNPAKALLEFFEGDFLRMASGEVILDTTATRAASKTLREIDVVSEELIGRYVESWREAGFL